MSNFKVGERVVRTGGTHVGMHVGDVGTIEAFIGTSCILKEFKGINQDGPATHDVRKFTLWEPAGSAAPNPAIKDPNPKDALGDKKVPLWLLSPLAKAQWAVAQFVGLVKYGAWNYRGAKVKSSIYLSAMQRHMDAVVSGEEFDPVDKTPHLGHIMACCAILIDAKAAGTLVDDRPPSLGIREAYAAAEAQMVLARENYGHMTPKHYTIADTQA